MTRLRQPHLWPHGRPPGPAPRGIALLLLAAAVSVSPAVPGRPSLAAQQQGAQTRVDLDFVATDINVVAKALSIYSKSSVVVLPLVKGQVTIRLVNVPVEEALRRTAAAAGADVLNVEGTFFIGTLPELRSLVARTGERATYTVKHARPQDLKELVQHNLPLLTVEVLGQTNILVLAGTRADLQAAMRIIEQQDVPAPVKPEPPKPEPPKPEILRQTYAVKFAKPTTLAEALAKGAPDVKVSVVERNLILEGTAAQLAQAATVLTTIDVQGAGERVVRAYNLRFLDPAQASVTLKVVFPNLLVTPGFETYSPKAASFSPLSGDTQAAFGGGGGGGGGQGGGQGGGAGLGTLLPGARSRVVLLAGTVDEVEQATQVLTSLDVAPQQVLIEARVVDISPTLMRNLGFTYQWSSLSFNEGGTPQGADRSFSFGKFQRSPFSFLATLDAMEQKRDARVLARPNIAVVDGEEASIFIGDIVRFERLAAQNVVGNQFTIETVPIGVALLCRPRVNGDGKLTLKVHPVVSTITGFGGRNRDIPQTSSREADSTILMQDGETIAIGGLLRDEDLKTVNKIPFIGDLPFLGQLFRSRNISRRRSEVTIFLTAKLLKG